MTRLAPTVTYVINLDRSPERWERLQPQLQAAGLPSPIRWVAVDGALLGDSDLRALQDAGRLSWDLQRFTPACRPGEIGCSLSHAAVLRDIVDRGHAAALVLEDDVDLAGDLGTWHQRYTQHVEDLPPDWDLWYLHRCLDDVTLCRRLTPRLVRPGCALGAAAYAVTRRGAGLMLASIEPLQDVIDRAYLESVVRPGRVSAYASSPMLLDYAPMPSTIRAGAGENAYVRNGVNRPPEYISARDRARWRRPRPWRARAWSAVERVFDTRAGHAIMRKCLGGAGTIVMLHRVLPEAHAAGIRHTRHLEISPEQLEQLLTCFVDNQYDVVSMDEVGSRRSGRFVAFTFDDGYRDVLEVALPVFERYQLPLTVYVTTGFPDRTIELWWYSLETLVRSVNHVQWPGGDPLPSMARKEMERAFAALHRRMLGMTVAQARDYLQTLSELNDCPLPVLDCALTWSQLQALAASPLVTIGAHTCNHLQLSTLSEPEARRELAEGRLRLQSELGCPVRHLAYPFGTPEAAGAREFRLARDLDFKTAVTSVPGSIRGGDLFRLPRISFHRDQGDLVPHARRALAGYHDLRRWAAAWRT